MSLMESFYGGRQGASFVIVKKFDCIDETILTNHSQYRIGWYAIDKDLSTDDNFVYYITSDNKLIERNANNFNKYKWHYLEKKGQSIDISVLNITDNANIIDLSQTAKESYVHSVTIKMKEEHIQGMVQHFQKGGITTSEVGYGEYVIIDTIFGLGEYNNPDNGKVFRRGMEFNGRLGGAEYIGQIVGPQGETPELGMTTIQELRKHEDSQIRYYEFNEVDEKKGLVPGRDLEDLAEGEKEFNDEITYGWTTFKDEKGNVIGSLIGFQFPFLVPQIISRERTPYYTQEDEINGKLPAGKLLGDRIESNSLELVVDNEEQVYKLVNPSKQRWFCIDGKEEDGITNKYVCAKDKVIVLGRKYYIENDVGNYSEVNLKEQNFYKKIEGSEGVADSYLLINASTTLPDDFVEYYEDVKHDVTYGETEHPFYRKWKLEIPHGIKGDSITQLKVIPAAVRPGSPYWTSKELAQAGGPTDYEVKDSVGAIVDISAIDLFQVPSRDETTGLPNDNEDDQIGFNEDAIPPFAKGNTPIPIKINGVRYWTQIQYTYKLKLKYVLTNYDNVEFGENTIEEIGDYNTIYKMSLDQEEGCFIIQYTAEDDKKVPVKILKNIYVELNDVNAQGIGEKIVDGIEQNVDLNSLRWDENLKKYVENSEVWDPNTGNKIQILNAGAISGSQRLKAQYLEWDEENQKPKLITDTIGDPINYIADCVVTIDDNKLRPNLATPANHLFVLYSDPEKRKKSLTKEEKAELRLQAWEECFPKDKTLDRIPFDEGYDIWNINYAYELDKAGDNKDNYFGENASAITIEDEFNEKCEELEEKKLEQKGNATTYVSLKYGERNDWVDLGYVGNQKEGIHIIDIITLAKDETFENSVIGPDKILRDSFPPEILHLISVSENKNTYGNINENVTRFNYENNRIKNYIEENRFNYQKFLDLGNTVDFEYSGYVYAVEKKALGNTNNEILSEVQLYMYSYTTEKWNCIGKIAYKNDPRNIIIVDSETVNELNNIVPAHFFADILEDNGIWLVQSNIVTAY